MAPISGADQSQGAANASSKAFANANQNSALFRKALASCTAEPESAALAEAIALDAGGTPEQYERYASKLAETLSQLTAAQRAVVFGGGSN
ncbi:MAG: hypothetical protein KDM64_17295 [Verrucomicrobiae bacterium]|nr:hypothetical protein [Verrucomicrobiae bacterium]